MNRHPLRNAYFGDLHVHTSLSSDAWMFDVRVMPDDAYRYAFGGAIGCLRRGGFSINQQLFFGLDSGTDCSRSFP